MEKKPFCVCRLTNETPKKDCSACGEIIYLKKGKEIVSLSLDGAVMFLRAVLKLNETQSAIQISSRRLNEKVSFRGVSYNLTFNELIEILKSNGWNVREHNGQIVLYSKREK